MRMVLQGTCRWTFRRFEGHPHPSVSTRRANSRLYSRPRPRQQDRTMGRSGVDHPHLRAGRRTLMLPRGTATMTTLISTVLIATRTRIQMIPLYRAWDIIRRCPNHQRRQHRRRSHDFTGSSYTERRLYGHFHQDQCPICWPGLAHRRRPPPSNTKSTIRCKVAGVPPELPPPSLAFRHGRNQQAVWCLGRLQCFLIDSEG